jgi:hypothetical protein
MKSLVKPKPKASPLKPGEKRPRFGSLFDPAGTPSPLKGVGQSGEVEQDAAEEISAALKAIIKQKRAMREVYRTTTDPEFWLCVCFQSREQKEEFLRLAGWTEFGDKYIDGLRVAAHLGVAIEPVNVAPLGAKATPKLLRGQTIEQNANEEVIANP